MTGNDAIAVSPAREPDGVGAALFALGFSSPFVQLVLMREMLGAFAGNEIVLGMNLGAWLAATGAGTLLGRTAGRLRNHPAAMARGLLLLAFVPMATVAALRMFRDAVFVHGAIVGVTETLVAVLILLLPYCVVSGFLLSLGCTMLAAREGAPGVGRGYVLDSLGSVAGGAVFSFVLVRWLGHFALLTVAGAVCLGAMVVVARLARCGRPRLTAESGIAAAGFIALVWGGALEDRTQRAQFPGQDIVFAGNSPYGMLVVAESAGQFNFLQNGLPVLSTGFPERAEEAVHYLMAQRPEARRVLLVSAIASGTAREVAKYCVEEIVCVELDPLLSSAGKRFVPDAYRDPRIRVEPTDGRLAVKRSRGEFDVIIADMPPPATMQYNRFYTEEFFLEAKRALVPGGVFGFSLGDYAGYISPEQARVLASAFGTLQQVFRNVLVLPAGRAQFIASDGDIYRDVVARIEHAGVHASYVNANYLDAMLTPDRFAELDRALAVDAPPNRDFAPALMSFQLRRWIDQFGFRFSALEAFLLLALCVYLVRLRRASIVVFASGFAASGIEYVLFVGIQVLYGSVYLQAGMVVTVFMAGLAAGGAAGNRLRAVRPTLLRLMVSLAALSAATPFALMALGRAGTGGVSLAAVQCSIGFLTFLLALQVGMVFPLAARAEYENPDVTPSRLYTADLFGACLGALLMSTLMVPSLGVANSCIATGGLCLVAGGLCVGGRPAKSR